jgi:hypothetical protein
VAEVLRVAKAEPLKPTPAARVGGGGVGKGGALDGDQVAGKGGANGKRVGGGGVGKGVAAAAAEVVAEGEVEVTPTVQATVGIKVQPSNDQPPNAEAEAVAVEVVAAVEVAAAGAPVVDAAALEDGPTVAAQPKPEAIV